MKTVDFPYIATGLGLLLLLVITKGSDTDNNGETLLPLLTLLIINECAFFLTAAGAFIGLKHINSIGFKISIRSFYSISTILCILLTLQFILLGIKLWPL